MDFNVGETVTQKTKELCEKIVLEYWYNTVGAFETSMLEKASGIKTNFSTIRARLHTIVMTLKLDNQQELVKVLNSKESDYDKLLEIYFIVFEHLGQEGILNYESAKSYHSELGRKVDYAKTL